MSHLLTLNQSDVCHRHGIIVKIVAFEMAIQNGILFFEGQMNAPEMITPQTGKHYRNA